MLCLFELFVMSNSHQIAEEVSRPLCEANKITMVSSGAGEVGAAKLSGEVLDIMTRLPDAVEKLTGVNISQVAHWFRSALFLISISLEGSLVLVCSVSRMYVYSII